VRRPTNKPSSRKPRSGALAVIPETAQRLSGIQRGLR
jgi:hypothetical protein